MSRALFSFDLTFFLFQATLYPDKNPKLSKFLAGVVGLDSVDDESVYPFNLLFAFVKSEVDVLPCAACFALHRVVCFVPLFVNLRR